MSTNKFQPGQDDMHPPLAPFYYSDTEAFAYRIGWMEGVRQGRFDAFNEIRTTNFPHGVPGFPEGSD